MKKFKTSILLLLFTINLLLTPFIFSKRVIFLHTNDEHGHFYGLFRKGKNINSFSQLTAWVETIRRKALLKNKKVILTFGGDMNTGTPESDELYARPDNQLFNMLKVDVAVLGNHEFDKPLTVLYKQLKFSKFPWLGANVYLKRNKSPLVLPYTILKADDIRIAILGLTTQQSEKIANRKVVKKLIFTNIVDEAKKYLPNLHKQADFVVALTHTGYYEDELIKPRHYEGEIGLAKKIKDFDLILGAHSHSKVQRKMINGTPIYQAGSYNKYLVLVEYEIKAGKKPVFIRDNMISLNKYPKEFYENNNHWWYKYLHAKVKNTQQTIALFKGMTEAKFSEVIGICKSTFHFVRTELFTQSTMLGNLIADSHREILKADFAIMNAGGIRSTFEKGKIAIKDVLTVSPFNNTLGTVKVTGKEVYNLFYQRFFKETNGGGFPHVSGIKILVYKKQKKLKITIQGKSLDLNKTYLMGINNYLAEGGLNYPNYIEADRFRDSGKSDNIALKKYIRKNSPIIPNKWKEARIEFK